MSSKRNKSLRKEKIKNTKTKLERIKMKILNVNNDRHVHDNQ